jgi:N-acetyl-gamma-glutamyl-phosphate reductase
MVRLGVLGATGYAGVELVRIAARHPEVGSLALSSESYKGKALSEVFPNLMGEVDIALVSQDEVIAGSDIVFAALPHGLCEGPARAALDKGAKFIDLGADFRLDDPETYKAFYGKEYADAALHAEQVYGLPELNRERIRKARLIGAPGCYPTSVALGLYPALASGLVKKDRVIADSKSGVSGAGRSLTLESHFAECNEAIGPYKIGAHRHRPEIEQVASAMAGCPVKVCFTPHLVPMNRGIVSTLYFEPAPGATLSALRAAYESMYAKEPFVRVLPEGRAASTRNVRYSNYCDISIHEDANAGLFIVASAIDNILKGAAGQAIQDMNIMLGVGETTGIDFVPPAV